MSQSQVDESPAIQAVRYQREARAFARIAQAVVLAVLACTSLSAQSFPGAKMYVIQNRKVKLVEVAFDLQDGSLVAVSKGKSPETVSIAYPEITRVEYERTAHRRWRVGRLGSALFLLSKAKKHWLAVFRSEEETVFQLSKKNYLSIIDAVEAKTGKEVEVIEEETDEQREALQAEIAKSESAAEAAEQEKRAQQALTNEEIALAVQKQLPEWMILARIEASECNFDLSVDALAALHDAGVPKAVITAMIGCEP